jgi:hypothetical protein
MYNINGWEKLTAVYDINGVTVDVISAEKSPTPCVTDTPQYERFHKYGIEFSIYHYSKGKSPKIYVRLDIYIDSGKCEIWVMESTSGIIQYRNWFDFDKVGDIFQTPQSFIRWLISTVNKQHRYFSPHL